MPIFYHSEFHKISKSWNFHFTGEDAENSTKLFKYRKVVGNFGSIKVSPYDDMISPVLEDGIAENC